MKADMKGVVLGVVEDDEGKPHVALGIPNHGLVVMAPPYAAMLFDQLGALLEGIGYFDNEKNSAAPAETIPHIKKGELH